FRPGSKLITSPLLALALATASRSDPMPLSASLVTVSTASSARPSRPSIRGANRARRRPRPPRPRFLPQDIPARRIPIGPPFPSRQQLSSPFPTSEATPSLAHCSSTWLFALGGVLVTGRAHSPRRPAMPYHSRSAGGKPTRSRDSAAPSAAAGSPSDGFNSG